MTPLDSATRRPGPGAVRRAGPGDEAIVRDVRLRALADAPDDFDSTRDEEGAWSTADWSRWIARGATFLLEGGGIPRGIAAGVPDRDDPRLVYLAALWVQPEARGSGAADRLVAAVMSWARRAGAKAVTLHVDSRNARAIRFYERCGFRGTGREVLRERDGLPETEMQLLLKRDSSSPGSSPPAA